MHAPSASRNIQSGCHAPNLNPGALSRLARSVPEAHALLNGLAAGEVTLAIGENHYPPSLPLTHPLAEVLARTAQLQTGHDSRRTPSRLGRRAHPRTAPGPATQAQPPTGAPHRRALLDRSLEIGELFTVSPATVSRALRPADLTADSDAAHNAGEPAPGIQPTWNTVAGTADLFNLGH